MISPFSARQLALPDGLPTGETRTGEHDVRREILRRAMDDGRKCCCYDGDRREKRSRSIPHKDPFFLRLSVRLLRLFPSSRFLLQRCAQPFSRLLDVQPQSALGGVGILRSQRVNHCRVPLDDLTERMMRLRDSQERRRRQPHPIPDLLEQPVIRRLDNREVERKICFDRAAVISAGGRGAHCCEETFELLERRRVHPRRRVPCCETFEDRPNRVKLHELLYRNLTDDGAAER